MTKREREGRGRGSDREDKAHDAADEAERHGGLGEWVKSFAIAAVLWLIIRTFLVQTFVITSGSMESTLLVGDFLMVNRVALGSRIPGTHARIPGYSEPHRFDIIVFDPPHEENLKLVKRLVGLPGDTLEMRDKILYINGERQDEPYVQYVEPQEDEVHPWMSWQYDYLAPGVDRETYRPTRDNWGPLVIPPGHYFMLGDNRNTSFDSRYWGLLERWRLEARVGLIYFSYNKESLKPFPWIREIRWGRIGHLVH